MWLKVGFLKQEKMPLGLWVGAAKPANLCVLILVGKEDSEVSVVTRGWPTIF